MFRQSSRESIGSDRFDMSRRHISMDCLNTTFVRTIDSSGSSIDIHREDFHTWHSTRTETRHRSSSRGFDRCDRKSSSNRGSGSCGCTAFGGKCLDFHMDLSDTDQLEFRRADLDILKKKELNRFEPIEKNQQRMSQRGETMTSTMGRKREITISSQTCASPLIFSFVRHCDDTHTAALFNPIRFDV